MSFLYPRLCTISRPPSTPEGQLGDVGYNAEDAAAPDDVLATGLPASIQLDRQGQRNPTGLASDAVYKPIWKIFIRSPPLGAIVSADVITDDLGVAYQVVAAYWDSMGYRVTAIILEV